MMSNPDGTFIYIGTYPDETAARVDYDVVKALHAVDAVGSFDAAVVTKDDKGKIHVNKDETATRTGGWVGVGVGALVGILFPPAILASATNDSLLHPIGPTPSACPPAGDASASVLLRTGQLRPHATLLWTSTSSRTGGPAHGSSPERPPSGFRRLGKGR